MLCLHYVLTFLFRIFVRISDFLKWIKWYVMYEEEKGVKRLKEDLYNLKNYA